MSMKSSLVIGLISVVSEFIKNNNQFTCFDVTRQLRHRQFDVNHEEVREVVHSLSGTDLPPFRGSGYVRNSHVNIGHGILAEVYAHKSDTSRYDMNALDPNAPIPAATPSYTSQTVTTTTTQGVVSNVAVATKPKATKKPAVVAKSNFASRDNRGRICVQNEFVRKLGLSAGDVAYISLRNGGTGLVVLTKPSKVGNLGQLTVDRNQNVRVTRHLQKQAGIAAKNSWKVRLSDDNRAVILIPQ